MVLLLCSGISFAQCPGCSIDYPSFYSLPDGGICKLVQGDGTVGQANDEDVSLRIPLPVFDAESGFNNDLQQITIEDIIGLHPGIDRECNSSEGGCDYFPPNDPPNTALGSIKLCGSLVSGIYQVQLRGKSSSYAESYLLHK